jgi:hypothetical protein
MPQQQQGLLGAQPQQGSPDSQRQQGLPAGRQQLQRRLLQQGLLGVRQQQGLQDSVRLGFMRVRLIEHQWWGLVAVGVGIMEWLHLSKL